MNKTTLWILVIVVVLVGAIFMFGNKPTTEIPSSSNATTTTEPSVKNGSYTIDGQIVQLTNGTLEIEAAPGSASKIVTQYFGNEATGDLNNDSVTDTAFLLTQTSGGSGTFYYIVAALKTETGFQGTNAVLLGDRIAPQTTEIRNGEIIVNYAIRAEDEAMTETPSVGMSKHFRVTGVALAEIK